MENQRKFLEDHDIKIQEIETVLRKIVADKVEKDNETDSGKTKKNCVQVLFFIRLAEYCCSIRLLC